jgi:hypothetical protein
LKNFGTLNLKYKTMKAKMQRGGLTATNRKTAMTALGIKPKSKEFDPSRFGDKANAGNSRKKYAQGGSQLGPVYSGPTGGRASAGTSGPQKQPTRITGKMQKGGNWVDKNIVDPANRWIDKNFRNPVNKKVAALSKKIDKNFTKPVNKRVAKVSKAVDRNFTDPVNKYLDQTIRKPKAVAKKAVVKKTVKVKPKKA